MPRADRAAPAIRIVDEPVSEPIPATGAVSSVQQAEIELPREVLERLWRPEYLERLARAYWRYLNRISLGLLRVVYEPDARTVVLVVRSFALLRFRAPEYETKKSQASVTWRIQRGLLVAKEGRGRGFLRIAVRRQDGRSADSTRLRLSAEVRNFYPWVRGSGRFARFGTWLYSKTQLRMHVLLTHGFLRSLARLDLPPSRVGALRGEIEGRTKSDATPRSDRLGPRDLGQ
jgi:hypothetical protein